MNEFGQRQCLTCETQIEGHFNRKRCEPCASLLRKRPAGKLTPIQEAMVRELAGTMFIKDLARVVGASDSNLDRWAKRNGVNINALKYPDHVVDQVCAYYQKYGKKKTQERFPHIKIRSIVERYNPQPRQTKWSLEEKLELVRMAGLVSPKGQAIFFNRPNANEGSIKSVWVKSFDCAPCSINGMTHWKAKHLVNIKARYLKPKGIGRDGQIAEFRKMILWVDMEKSLKNEVPDFLVKAIKTMADFQRWLWKDQDPKPKIIKMIKQREL